MIKKAIVTCDKCKERFLITNDCSVINKILSEEHYICFACEDEKREETKND